MNDATAEDRAPAKKSGVKRPGTCTVQSLTLASDALSDLVTKLDARTSVVVAAAITALARLDTPTQVQLIQDVRVAYANEMNS